MKRLTVKKTPWMDYAAVLGGREEFKTSGALYASSFHGHYYGPVGRLAEEYRSSVSEADYVVYSYNTPIAWHSPDGWHMPEVSYSVTTTAHQGKIFFVKDWQKEGIA